MKKIITHPILTENIMTWWCDKNEINHETARRKGIDIYRKFKFLFFTFFHMAKKIDTPNVNFYLTTTKRFYRNLQYPIQERLSLLNSRNFQKHFAEKLPVSLICLSCTLTCLCTVISRSSLRRLFFVIVIDFALIPPYLVKKSNNK